MPNFKKSCSLFLSTRKFKRPREHLSTGTPLYVNHFYFSVSVGMPKSMLGVYQDLQEKLSKAAVATEEMTSTSDLSIKKYRFRLQNAVTSTINSISANSGEDLRGKISRLRRLIGGSLLM